MFKRSKKHLRRLAGIFFSLGMVRFVGQMASLYIIMRSEMAAAADILRFFAQSVFRCFGAALITYIISRLVKDEGNEEPAEKPAPQPENENLIPDEKLGRIVSRVGWVFTILALGGILLFYELRVR